MDIKLPDGTIVRNVPEGMSQEDLMARLSAHGYQPAEPKAPKYDAATTAFLAGLTERGWGTGWPKFAYDIGAKVADFATSKGASPETAALFGYGTNVALNAAPGFLTSGKFLNAPNISILEQPAKWMMQSAVKPSSTLERSKVDRALTTLLEENVSPTNAGVQALKDRSSSLAEKVANILKPSNKVVSVTPAAQNVASVADKARQATFGVQDASTATNVANVLRNHPSVDQLGLMSVQDAQAMKVANYKQLGDAAYGVGLKPMAERDALKAATRGLRTAIEGAEPAVAEPNAKIQELLNAIKVIQRRALIEGNKDILPLGTSVAMAANNPAAALGLYANSSAAVKGLLARLMYVLGRPSSIQPAAFAANAVQNSEGQ